MEDLDSREYLHKLQIRVLSGLINPDGENTPATLAEFHENVFPETFLEPVFSAVCRAAKELYARTGNCDVLELASDVSSGKAGIRAADVRAATSIVFEAADDFSVNSVTLSRYLPMLQRAALSKCLPAAQKELEKAVAAGTPYEEAYDKFVRPVVERSRPRAHERFDVAGEVRAMRNKVDGFRRSEILEEHVVPTGFPSVDKTLRGGMRPSQLIVVGARPATGKTTLALNIAANVVANSDGHVVFVSLEQTADQLVEKIVSLSAGCIFPKTRTELERVRSSGALDRIEKAAKEFDFSRFHVVEKADNVDALCRIVAELCSKHKVEAVFIDYLQLIPSAPGERSRYESVTRISNRLKVLAKDVGAPVVCLAQLSRGSENEARPPRLADLRDSGAIEQDADVAALLYNEVAETEDEISISSRRTVNFDVRKNRNGGLCRVMMDFALAESKFSEKRRTLF